MGSRQSSLICKTLESTYRQQRPPLTSTPIASAYLIY
jgi:hypothetical protein